ncbi:MAG: type II and III secretion system protein, partial [Aquificae bacterium]|nr:type II and III secretion system protein [Aquificota bacterium]
ATLVIGGVVEKERRTTEEGIPKVKEVPLLGWLFKGRATDEQDRELLIFITPEVVKDED